ncbi:MAG: hypothetical protein IKZ58_03630 [Selenomonadaceae bacterium]|nr:hypothetical protein [Selenomonadaceae bacterium]
MKNFLLSILICAAFLLTSTTAFASVQEQIIDGADLTRIKRLAVAYPNHYKISTVSDEPTIEALIEMLGTANKSTKFTVIPYTDIVEIIKKDKDVDITALDYRDSKKAFEENIANYADSYLTLTTANNDDPTTFMFKIQNAQTGDVMYLLTIKNNSFKKNANGYNSACELFYKTLDVAIEKAAKK